MLRKYAEAFQARSRIGIRYVVSIGDMAGFAIEGGGVVFTGCSGRTPEQVAISAIEAAEARISGQARS